MKKPQKFFLWTMSTEDLTRVKNMVKYVVAECKETPKEKSLQKKIELALSETNIDGLHELSLSEELSKNLALVMCLYIEEMASAAYEKEYLRRVRKANTEQIVLFKEFAETLGMNSILNRLTDYLNRF
jgi:hypothetical protein